MIKYVTGDILAADAEALLRELQTAAGGGDGR